MNDTTNPPSDDTGPGMTHEQVQRFEEMLRLDRDIHQELAAKAGEAKQRDVEMLHEVQLWTLRNCLNLLHVYSSGQYGEPYHHPETEKK
ncbi:hypothetical protein ABZ215_24840 [Amycolatopsis sp. NPDC006131]|uniref:hypothetical protein n=1 Tax=Amycolatopsis sp. NPDC006131 TaxID=3156731 RepID=UPI00339EB857